MFHLIVSAPGSETKFTTGKGLSDMMDKFLVLRRNRADLAPETGVLLAKEVDGRLVNLRRFVTEAVALPALNLSDAMLKALFSDEGQLTGLAGKANTLRALESRGLVKIDNVGVARLTNLGRQYQKKGA